MVYGGILDDGILDINPIPNELDEFDNPIYRLIYHDSKLSKDAPWTDNQLSEIINQFRTQPSPPYLEFEVRNNISYFKNYTGSKITTGSKIRIYREDIYKSYLENGNLKTIQFFE